jgi:hypothetical protein
MAQVHGKLLYYYHLKVYFYLQRENKYYLFVTSKCL